MRSDYERQFYYRRLYKNRPVRIYRDYAPTLRAERLGLKVVEIETKEVEDTDVKNQSTK